MSSSGLSEFQIELANLFFSLPESAGFLLAGGGALMHRGSCPAPPRTSTSSPPARSATSKPPAMHSSLRSWPADGRRTSSAAAQTSGGGPSPDPRRSWSTSPSTAPPPAPPPLTIAGPALAPADLVVRKTLALFGRAEPHDYIDVYVLNQRFNREDTLAKAAEADQGFNQDVFVQALRATDASATQTSPTSAHPSRTSAATSMPGPTNSTGVDLRARHR